MRPGSVERFDPVYTRHGVASLFTAFEPLRGWRERLVMDQLNTHRAASLYEAFAPEQAWRLAERLEIHHTPKHGSWLNMAEIELSVLARQCLSRRLARAETLREKVQRWVEERNGRGSQGDWPFAAADARVKLRRLYPSSDG